ncbi:Flavin reductase family domain protein [Candidatus Trichorickettsia mobilis]|uniref:Flavin reductase family domain protein n=1 Tax=Candidatus Trichorickettsia mobilis TaxID=1346319 RepID=A0ABZ0UU80_9RICK|nr:flavin reductase family protein [Candidatus Trichorickettsia mobilis]WPY01371.1 Flavin reductase family domain protein [Candidatus Trichorickettsia mobilis]
MGCLPTGITVVSTNYERQLLGFTANSFTSVSLSPPLILFCLNKNAGSIAAFQSSSVFAISILAANQVEISKHFSTSQPNKFSSINYQIGKITSCPLIIDAVCWVECKKYQEYEGGDHLIFVGEVLNTTINNDRQPLVYFSRNYRELK